MVTPIFGLKLKIKISNSELYDAAPDSNCFAQCDSKCDCTATTKCQTVVVSYSCIISKLIFKKMFDSSLLS